MAQDQVIDKVFDVYETGGGGDCLFYSLGFALNNNMAVSEDEALKIRHIICNRHDIIINGVNVEEFKIEGISGKINAASSDGRMCNQGVWGEDVEIAKAARIFDIPIIVYQTNHNTGMYDGVVREFYRFNEIQNGRFCPQMQKYFVNDPFINVSTRLTSYYLPEHSNNKEPILILNKGQAHYQILLPKDSKVVSKPASINSHEEQVHRLFELLNSKLPEDLIIEYAKITISEEVIKIVVDIWKKYYTTTGPATSNQPLELLPQEEQVERLVELLNSKLPEYFIIEYAKRKMVDKHVDIVVDVWRKSKK